MSAEGEGQFSLRMWALVDQPHSIGRPHICGNIGNTSWAWWVLQTKRRHRVLWVGKAAGIWEALREEEDYDQNILHVFRTFSRIKIFSLVL